jgi:hypothetical protein
MMPARAERVVRATSEIVWSMWEDVESSPRWDRDVVWSRLAGPFEAGTFGEFALRSGRRVRFELTRVDPPRGYQNRARFMRGLSVLFSHDLVTVDASHTRVLHHAEPEGLLGRLLSPVLRRVLKGALERGLGDFQSLAEAMSVTAPR